MTIEETLDLFEKILAFFEANEDASARLFRFLREDHPDSVCPALKLIRGGGE